MRNIALAAVAALLLATPAFAGNYNNSGTNTTTNSQVNTNSHDYTVLGNPAFGESTSGASFSFTGNGGSQAVVNTNGVAASSVRVVTTGVSNTVDTNSSHWGVNSGSANGSATYGLTGTVGADSQGNAGLASTTTTDRYSTVNTLATGFTSLSNNW